MTWDECEWWEGEIELEFGARAALSVTPYDPSVSRVPMEAQREAVTYYLEQGRGVFTSVLTSLSLYYDKLRPRCIDFFGSEAACLMPIVRDTADFSRLIDLRHIHVHPWSKDGIVYVGLQFGCTWDREHGFGVLMHRDRVVSVGSADVSFAWSPDEADDPT